MSSLTITAEYHQEGTSDILNQRTRMWHFPNSNWVDVDIRQVDAPVDTTVVVPVPDAAPYISPTGEVRVKTWMSGTKTAWTHYIDLVKITAAQ